MRKLLAALVAASLMLPIIAVAPAAALDSCTSNTGSPTWSVKRNDIGRQYTHAIGQTIIRQLDACFGSDGTRLAAVLVNVGGMGDGAPLFLQVGYGDRGYGLQWLASTDDYPSGNIDGVGLGFGPVPGHLVQFEIVPYSSSEWRLYIRDKTTGMYGWRPLARHYSFGTGVWYGIEVHNQGDDFGGYDSSHRTNLDYLGYQYNGDGTSSYTYLTGTGKSGWANDESWRPSTWIYGITTIGTDQYTRLWGYDTSA